MDTYEKKIKNLQHAAFETVSDIIEGFRRPFVWCLIGANRTGKTTTMIKMARSYKRANPRNRIIAHDPQGFLQQAGLVDILINTHNKDWAKTLCKRTGHSKGLGGAREFVYGDCLLILDDFRQLHKAHQMDLDFLALLGLRTKMNLDIIYSVWSPINLLDQLSGFTTKYSIFYTMAAQGGFSDKIPNYVPCQQASILINKYVMAYNIMDRGRELHPNFPYMLVSDDNDHKISPVNVDKKALLKLINTN